MHYDMTSLEARKRYKLLSSLVVPRPIAWVSTLSPEGVVNLAPYSFFNVMGHDPALVALGILEHPEKPLKDTVRNITETGRFTVNLVTEALAARMNQTATDLPYAESEADLAAVEMAPASANGVPGIARSPVRLECQLMQIIPSGTRQKIVLGDILALYVQDTLLIDSETVKIDLESHRPIARMGGAGIYCRTADCFSLARPDSETQPLD
ncbi:flavin reductase family protein [Celeribacter sp. SCSIO 80788]|uniref:flavin reductase family protein n=1 Tax=Celeribacter sp. SCSIO 80788 TaxID=3117013 RepID=UPI003DA50859